MHQGRGWERCCTKDGVSEDGKHPTALNLVSGTSLSFADTMLKVIVQSLSHVWLSVIPWTATCHISLSFTISQSHVHWLDDAIQPSHLLSPPSPQSFPASRSSPVSGLFTSGGQSIGDSASPSVLPKYIQAWFPLGLTGLISLLCKGLSRVSTTVQKQFFSDRGKNKKCEVDKN